MRALTISAHGGVEQISLRDDLPIPELRSPTDVRIHIMAGALNHLDLFVLGGMPGISIVPPWILGGDGAGVIDAIGEGVTGFSRGDPVVINPGISDRTCQYCLDGEHSLCISYRLLGEHLPGTFAEYLVVSSANVRTIPRGTSWDVAAAFTLAMLTAWRMVVTRARVSEGDNVLIWGIGGGVALAALQIAKLRGARVWVTSGNDTKLARARAIGADETLNHRTQDVAREIRSRTGKRGVDVVIDNVGSDTWKASLGSLGKRGRLVTCGATSGPLVQTDVRRMFWNQWSLMGSTMGNESEFDAVVQAFREGKLVPVVDSVFPLVDGRRAFERLESGEQFGKVVVSVGGQ